MSEVKGRYITGSETQEAMEMLGKGYRDPTKMCWYCGKPAEQKDHVIPKHLGGKGAKDNLVPVCKWCNKSKRAYPLAIWRRIMAKKYGMTFTEEQRNYWNEHGIKLPDDAVYKFYFELMGWTL